MAKRRKHQYLEMNLDFECKGKVKISMIPYVEEIINNFSEGVGALTTATPAANHLFQVRTKDEAKILLEEQAI